MSPAQSDSPVQADNGVRSLPVTPSPDARARVFCVPYSGCGASLFRRWPRSRHGVEYCPVQPPGREYRMRDPTYTSYQDLAEQLSFDLALYLDRPFALFGHCGSALAVYQMAVEFERRGLPSPTRIYVSSQVAPQDGPAGRFLSMNDEELLGELSQLLSETGAVPPPGMLELYLEVLLADIEANKRFIVPEPARISCPITVIGWLQDDQVPIRLIGGWDRCGDVTNVYLPGQHHQFVAGEADLLDVLEAGVLGAGT